MAVDYQIDSGAGQRQIAEGHDTAVQCRVMGPGGAVVPTAASVTLYRPGAVTTVISLEYAAIGTDGVVTYTYSTADVGGETLGEQYVEEWLLTIAGLPVYHRRSAALVRRTLFMPITTETIYQLDPTVRDSWPDTQADWSPQLTLAWDLILTRLQQARSTPWEAIGAESYRTLALRTAAELIYGILSEGDPSSRWEARRLRQEAEAELEWARLTVDMDSDDDGATDTTGDSVEHYAEASAVGGPSFGVRDW